MCDVVVVVLFLFLEIHILLFVNFRSHDEFKNSDLNFAIVYLTIYFRGCHVHIPIAVPRILPSFNCIIIDGCVGQNCKYFPQVDPYICMQSIL